MIQRGDRVRYIGRATNLQGHIGVLGYASWTPGEWTVYWESPQPHSPSGHRLFSSSRIRTHNLAIIPPGRSSHHFWQATA